MSKYQKTKYPGVRYVEHPTRKHGVQFDKYFSIYFKIDGKQVEEACGWGSEGMTAAKAAAIRSTLKENHRRGEGVRTLREKRSIETERREAEESAKQKAEVENMTFAEFFSTRYMPLAQTDKAKHTCIREQSFFKVWISPHIGNKPLKSISPMDVERIKKAMLDAGRAPRSVEYCLALIRQVFNRAIGNGIFSGPLPTARVKRPKFDNQRTRFLSPSESESLLEDLRLHSPDYAEMATVSLYGGLRLGEIFNLTWGAVDFENNRLHVRDTKSRKDRALPMGETLRNLFLNKPKGSPNDLVFPARGGGKRTQISKVFMESVDRLGLNSGVSDPREKVSFHNLRHSFASRLVQSGVDLYVVKTLLGHQNISQTQRYSHLAPGNLESAVALLESAMNAPSPSALALAGGGSSEN